MYSSKCLMHVHVHVHIKEGSLSKVGKGHYVKKLVTGEWRMCVRAYA